MLGVTICVQEGGSTVNYANQQTQSKSRRLFVRIFPSLFRLGFFIRRIYEGRYYYGQQV